MWSTMLLSRTDRILLWLLGGGVLGEVDGRSSVEMEGGESSLEVLMRARQLEFFRVQDLNDRFETV